MFEDVVAFIRSMYRTTDCIPLHAPRFDGNEKRYLTQCIDSTFVSSVGEYVTRFEEMIAAYTGAKHAVVTVNGTSALHVALKLTGVNPGDEVITQALTFVATANAITYCGATPFFIDVDLDSLSLSPDKLERFFKAHTERKDDGYLYNTLTGRRIVACVPMHTFGLPGRIEKIVHVCNRYKVKVVEDAAESLGSFSQKQHTGTFGVAGILSFNGNKIITTGGGGMILSDDDAFAHHAKHITTTGKKTHPWEYVHDTIAYNYRMPNVNAALGCAQLEQLNRFLDRKRKIALRYQEFFKHKGIRFICERQGTSSNYWLNGIVLNTPEEKERFLKETNEQGVMTRPIWKLMSDLPMFNKDASYVDLENSQWLEARVVNIPSSVMI